MLSGRSTATSGARLGFRSNREGINDASISSHSGSRDYRIALQQAKTKSAASKSDRAEHRTLPSATASQQPDLSVVGPT